MVTGNFGKAVGHERWLTIDDEVRFVQVPKSRFLTVSLFGMTFYRIVQLQVAFSAINARLSDEPSWLPVTCKHENRLVQSAKSRFLRNDVSATCSAATKVFSSQALSG
jgi:hypothetical protein